MWSSAHRKKNIYRYDAMLGLTETIDQLAVASSDRWNGHVLRREDGHDKRTLDFEVEGQRTKGGQI